MNEWPKLGGKERGRKSRPHSFKPLTMFGIIIRRDQPALRQFQERVERSHQASSNVRPLSSSAAGCTRRIVSKPIPFCKKLRDWMNRMQVISARLI